MTTVHVPNPLVSSVSAFFPCYNDALSIGKMVRDVHESLVEAVSDFEIIRVVVSSLEIMGGVISSAVVVESSVSVIFIIGIVVSVVVVLLVIVDLEFVVNIFNFKISIF